MARSYLIDDARLNEVVQELLSAIGQSPSDSITFESGYLHNAEGYKEEVYEKAREVLNSESWDKSGLGSGRILDSVLKAIKAGGNLVDYRTNGFIGKAKSDMRKAESILFDVYRGDNPEAAFNAMLDFFGGNYNRTAYLFFLKDRDKERYLYLPVKPQFFQAYFSWLHIQSDSMSGCTWEHYQEFIQIIGEIRDKIQPRCLSPISLLDAHSLVWSLYLLEGSDSNFRDYAEGQFSLSSEQWTEILGNRALLSESDILLLCRFYISSNHAASCAELGKLYDVHPSSFISRVVSMAKRIIKAYHLPVLYRGSQQYCWPALFLGKRLTNGYFEWKMRPELVEAFGQSCAELIENERYNEDVRQSVKADDHTVLRIALERSDRECRKKSVISETYVRDPYISKAAKIHANGFCTLCKKVAPFQDKCGNPYLETHHIIWLSKGGKDSLENVVALCPNCHKKMHVLDDEKDKSVLSDCARDFFLQEQYAHMKK